MSKGDNEIMALSFLRELKIGNKIKGYSILLMIQDKTGRLEFPTRYRENHQREDC